MSRKYIKVKVQYIKKDKIVEFKGEKKIFFCTVRESHFFDKYGTLLKIFPKYLSLVGIWHWRFLKEKDALWRKVIRNIFRDDGGSSSMVGLGNSNSVWCNILSSGVAIDALSIPFRRKVISCTNTLFWKDVWIDDGPCLMAKFPRLYALESNPNCRVCDRWVLENDV